MAQKAIFAIITQTLKKHKIYTQKLVDNKTNFWYDLEPIRYFCQDDSVLEFCQR